MATEKNYATEIDAIKGDVHQLREDISALLSAFGDDAGESGAQAREAALAKLRQARAQGTAHLQQVEKSIEDNPLIALAGALGLGFLIGALLNRR
ncbi:hypothetical protein JCM17846_22490 [Iodidimonas nitroreducens]|uniref:DUF883 domain-containing protein n=1 Tax=Iodidimonas nitroreducens TaxID=1236968 RepID=A0A5A7N9G8_9PROT|nr:DUF883 family protein [Iodidimonas nitroreducens]GAK32541.1 hypothetical protein AQ1_00407 [alpha proteobacterium Q-1]GER04567.1 hypothetical protein JCM17846_22490 [Iodidimonas nitroreducens]